MILSVINNNSAHSETELTLHKRVTRYSVMHVLLNIDFIKIFRNCEDFASESLEYFVLTSVLWIYDCLDSVYVISVFSCRMKYPHSSLCPIYIHTRIHTYIYVDAYIHTRIYTYTYTYIHTRIHTCVCMCSGMSTLDCW